MAPWRHGAGMWAAPAWPFGTRGMASSLTSWPTRQPGTALGEACARGGIVLWARAASALWCSRLNIKGKNSDPGGSKLGCCN